MQKFIIYFFKGFKLIRSKIIIPFDFIFTFIVLYRNGFKFSSFVSHGIPLVNIALGGNASIGKNFRMNNRELSNPIGRFNHCSIIVGPTGKLLIGDNVGMSSSAIVCHNSIIIGNNVKLGGNVVIYDTDFHSLEYSHRLDRENDQMNTNKKPITIGNNVFIGAHNTILKGVSIGENAVVGACSVVTKNIPSNEIWAGNPARFIRKI